MVLDIRLWLRRMNRTARPEGGQCAESTVTEIAINGFAELGRFAVAYRNLFGALPSATLRRGFDRG